MAKHTPEPWAISPDYGVLIGDAAAGEFAKQIADLDMEWCTKEETYANAARIVACVNYCAGMPDEALRGPVNALAGRDPKRLEALVEAWGDGPSSVMDEQRVLAAVAAFLGEGDEA